MKKYLLALAAIIIACSTPKPIASTNVKSSTVKNIGVIELRNYLVKSGQAESFNTLFSDHFLNPMREMGVSVLGKYKIKNNEDHFVWIRGYANMAQRVQFLNDFYYRNEEWKKHKKEANDLIRNSDNVYLLQPLDLNQDNREPTISSAAFKSEKPLVCVDFYIANTRLNELTTFFTKEYQPILKSAAIETTLWTSVPSANDFPQLPVFQDKNLLMAISYYDSESDYNKKNKLLNRTISEAMKTKMADIVTTHSRMLLHNFMNL